MTDTFKNPPQQDIFLDQVRELPVVFERVIESQKSLNLAESELRLQIVQQDLDASNIVIEEYRRTLAEKVIETGNIDPMDQSRGLILMTRLNELLAERDSLVESIKFITELQTAMGHLAVASAMIASLDERLPASVPIVEIPEKPNIIGHFDVPVDATLQPTTSVVFEVPKPEVPKPTLPSNEMNETIQQTDYAPRFPPANLPGGFGRKTLKPLHVVQKVKR